MRFFNSIAWSLGILLGATAVEGQPRGGVIRYGDFGAVGDGKADDFEALVKAHAHANEHGLPVVADDQATYYIGGADRTVVIQTDTDFGEAKFIIDDTDLENLKAPVFEVRSAHQPVALRGVDSLKRGQARIRAEWPGPCVVIAKNAGVKHFIRSGLNPTAGESQTDVFLVDAQGRVDERTPIQWDFDAVTQLQALPVDEELLTIRGGRFTTIANRAESNYDYHARGISVRRSQVVIDGLEHRIEGEGKSGAPYRGFITISDCSDVEVRNTVLTGHKTYRTIGRAGKSVSMGSYDITVNRALNVSLVNVTQSNDIMDRSRWGIMGSNYCKNLTYDGCRLSRFDAHKGVFGATIRNSTLGYMGVKLTGGGTFLMEGSTVHSRHLVDLRRDYGSTWDGEVIIRNCRLVPPKSERSPAILGGFNDGRHDFGYTCQLPERITVEKLHIEEAGGATPVIFEDFRPQGQDVGPHEPVITREVVLDGVTIASGKPLRLSEHPEMFGGVRVKRKAGR